MIALWLPYPFALPFMQRALAAGVIVGVFAPMIGIFLVQKRLSLIGDGIGHVAFAGVGAGLLLGVDPVLAVFASLGGGLNANILTYLFGQPLTVTRSEIGWILVLGSAIAITMWALRNVLFAVVTDEDWSRVAGLPVGMVNGLLAVLTAVAVVAAMRVVGILLVAALMVLPVASAQLLARSFRATLLLSIAVGVGSVVVGLAASYIFDIAPSGAMVLAAAAVFAIVSIGKRAAPRTLRQEEHA